MGDGAGDLQGGYACSASSCSSTQQQHPANGGALGSALVGAAASVTGSDWKGGACGAAARGGAVGVTGATSLPPDAELQAELNQLRRDVKQLRIENRNVYWLDDECKRLRAELEAALQRH